MQRLSSHIVADILHASHRILAKLASHEPDALWRDEDLQDIVIRCFTVIGEASTHLPESVRSRFPHINWKRAISFRNFIVHEYFRTEWEKVLAAAQTLPEMIVQWEQMFALLQFEESGH